MIVKLFAGLGNQLFQYAYGEAQRAAGRQVLYFMAERRRGDLLDVFNIDPSRVRLIGNRLAAAAYKALHKFLLRDYAVGFFQEWRYAVAASATQTLAFRAAGLFEKEPIAKAVSLDNAVAVHIRGGDYLTEGGLASYGGICTANYYREAITMVSKALASPRFFVFTNDRSYAGRLLEGFEADFVFFEAGEPDPGFDLYLMSRCRRAIISNSTFAWWGAFLGGAEKLVICPDKWNNDDPEVIDKLCPPHWRRITLGESRKT